MSEFRIVPRSEWGATGGNGKDATRYEPWDEFVVHTEAGALRPEDWRELQDHAAEYAALNASMTEIQKVRAVENFHVKTRGWDGIAYSMFITHDGTIFEGRGWGRSGAHTEGENYTAAGVCLQGHGDPQPATEAQWLAMRWLIAEGARLGHLVALPRLIISGHREHSLKGKTCPGNLIYPELHRLRRSHTPAQKDDFMARLSDEEQEELLTKTREIHAELFTSVPSEMDDKGHETKAGTLRWRLTKVMERTSDLVTGRRPERKG